MKKVNLVPSYLFLLQIVFALALPLSSNGQNAADEHPGPSHQHQWHPFHHYTAHHYAAHFGMNEHAYKNSKLWEALEIKLKTLKKAVELSPFVREVKNSLKSGSPMDSFEYLNRLAALISTSERYADLGDIDIFRVSKNLKQIEVVVSISNELGSDAFQINGAFSADNFLRFDVRVQPTLRSNPVLALMISAKLLSIFGGYIMIGEGESYAHHMQQHSHEIHQSLHNFEAYSTLKSTLGIVEGYGEDSFINSIEYPELQFNAKHGRWSSQYELLQLDRRVLSESRDSISKFLLTKGLTPQQLNKYSREIMQVMRLNSAKTPPEKMYLSLWLKLKDLADERIRLAKANADLESKNDAQKIAQLQDRLANSDLDWMRAIRESDYATVAKIMLDPMYLGLGHRQSVFNPSVHATLLRYARVIEAMAKDIKSVEMITVFRGLDAEDMANFYGRPDQGGGNGFLPPPMMSHGGASNSTLRFIQRYLAKPTRDAMTGTYEHQRERLISRMFQSHSGQANGSFYLSTSVNPGVAQTWAEAGIAVIRIPKALAVPNALSGFVTELENLAFVIFPGKEDEKLSHVSTLKDFNCETVMVEANGQNGKLYKKASYQCHANDDFIRKFIQTHAPGHQGKELVISEFYSEYFGEMSRALVGYEQLKQ